MLVFASSVHWIRSRRAVTSIFTPPGDTPAPKKSQKGKEKKLQQGTPEEYGPVPMMNRERERSDEVKDEEVQEGKKNEFKKV